MQKELSLNKNRILKDCGTIKVYQIHNGNATGKDKQKKYFKQSHNFHKFLSATKLQIQEASKTPSRINSRKTTPKHMISTLQKVKDKEKILKETKGKKILLIDKR